MKKRTTLAVLVASTLSLGCFLICGILLMPADIGATPDAGPVDDPISGVEYYSSAQNCGLLCIYEDGSGALLYLDFEKGGITAELYNDHAREQAISSRFPVNYTLQADADFLTRFCDRIGGIDLSEGGGKRRYFSAGLRQKLSEKTDSEGRAEIISAFFERIAKMGLSSGDFMFIIEETKTNLSYPVCYGWVNDFATLAQNIVLEGG